MRVIFLGSGRFAQPTLQWLAQSDHAVPLVVTQPARPSGRGRHVTRTPVRQLATELGITTIEAEDVNEPGVLERLQALHADLGLVIAFGQKLGPKLLSLMPGGCINLHASLLPRCRGAAPVNWAIIRGEQRTGCTVFRLVAQMDAGPILTSSWTTIKPEETAGELHDRLAAIGVDTVQAALGMYPDESVGQTGPQGKPQDETAATWARKLSKADGFLRFDQPTVNVANFICGMSPWPGAAARFHAADGRWEDVTITRARPVSDPSVPRMPPGTIDARCHVAAQDGFVEILEIKPSSGRQMTWPDYVNGRHVTEGDRLVST